MSTPFSLSIRLSPEVKQCLDDASQRIGVPRDSIVEYAVRELLQDLGYGKLGVIDHHQSLQAFSEQSEEEEEQD